ncbi:MAG: hypothetical protein FJ104_12500 [Deltaproteobacteria bacterium]|nr:hypothetical protein [Deltaproteobacteria bacterium]
MTPTVDIGSLPAPAQRLFAEGAPPPLRLLAAGGVIPGLRPGDIVAVVVALTSAPEPQVADKARATLAALPGPVLSGALTSDLDPAVVEALAHGYPSNAEVVVGLLRMPRVTRAALETLAKRATEQTGELIATNEQKLLANPTVIELLYMNRSVRMSTADRVLELAVRNGLELDIPAFKEAALAIQGELLEEPSQEPTFDDRLAAEVTVLAEGIALDSAVEDTHETDDEGNEQVAKKVLPLHARIAELSISKKIRLAILGTAAERMLLVRDTNRLVAAAAIQSPRTTEHDVARISTSRQVSEDVLRLIANNKEWTRSYQIKLNLVMNPRTPFSFASRLVPHIRESELRSLAKNKNVPAQIQSAARQQLQRKAQGKKA